MNKEEMDLSKLEQYSRLINMMTKIVFNDVYFEGNVFSKQTINFLISNNGRNWIETQKKKSQLLNFYIKMTNKMLQMSSFNFDDFCNVYKNYTKYL